MRTQYGYWIGGALLSLMAVPANAQTSVETGVSLNLQGPADVRAVQYQCEEREERLAVTYINAAPNFLAVLEIEEQQHIFAATIAASGVRYVSDKYVWWTKGAEATLFDETAGEDADPVWQCLEANNIP